MEAEKMPSPSSEEAEPSAPPEGSAVLTLRIVGRQERIE